MTPRVAYPPAAEAWFATGFLCAAYAFSFLDRQILALLLESIRADLEFSDTQLGLLGGFAFALFYTIAGLPIARFADSRNRKFVIISGLVVWSLMTAVCGLARNFITLFLARVGVGIGEAALSPAAYSMLSDYFPPEKRGRALSVYAMGSVFGLGAAYLAGGLLLGYFDALGVIEIGPLILRPWQATFITVGLPGLLLALVMLAMREPQRQIAATLRQGETAEPRELWQFLKLRRGILTAHFAGLASFNIALNGFNMWLPAHFTRAYGWDASTVGLAFAAVVLFGGASGVVVAGLLGDRAKSGDHRARRYFTMMTIAAVIAVPVLGAAALMPSPYLSLALLGPGVMLTAFPAVCGPAILQFITPNRLLAQTSALYLFVIAIIGLGGGPLLVGLINDLAFGRPDMLGVSISITAIVSLSLSVVCLNAGRLIAASLPVDERAGN